MSSGTQSPPVESTGEDSHIPLGKSSVGGGQPEGVKDADQRKQYFGSSDDKHTDTVGEVGTAVGDANESADTAPPGS
ncbi:hypothetical protein SISNIDRAFT_547757 [Sistotremastrum niveocremeum HHB9708]|uniref:Uncharacterized protein n=2 Tax=Sistotremastraceae TaxID=3402574 RepID=A0A164XU91_9AGAM|nr:hypothetical protein SISNIDRAFT_547757 [Sistotremastrum niveocremeum HHB9708]KZT37028.1 hypothetical protein SISSUDRAFT_1129935 [Sistotremastrum suecicum HHB10207 ss-3]